MLINRPIRWKKMKTNYIPSSSSRKLILDKNRRRVEQCPCGKDNKDGKFVPFVGYKTKGYCHSCGETFLPEFSKDFHRQPVVKKQGITSYIPLSKFDKSLSSPCKNNFVHFLRNKFGPEITKYLMEMYFIDSSDHWRGATIFWQIDNCGKIRTGKIMLYDEVSGRRIKDPISISWYHKIEKLQNYYLKQCLYGEHLLSTDSIRPIGLVESEKTAIIASVFLPELIWLATGGKDGFTISKCKALEGRNTILFPDLNAYDLWSKKAGLFQKELPKLKLTVSDFIEKYASVSERKSGWDLADFLIRDFNETNPKRLSFLENRSGKNSICKN